MIRLIALLDSIIGVIAICAAFAVGSYIDNQRHLTTSESVALALVAANGVATLIASHGLMRLQPYGLSFHRISAYGWLAASCIALAKLWGGRYLTIALFAVVPLSLSSLASLGYLGGDAVGRRLETTGDAVSWPARLLIVADMAVMLAFYTLVYPKVKPLSARTDQARTMADMRTIAAAVEAFRAEHKYYPAAPSLTALRPLLEPTYLRSMPGVDAWRNAFRYEAWSDRGDERPRAQHYAIASAGNDRNFEQPSLRSYQVHATESFASDIVFRDGAFISYPNLEYNPRRSTSTAAAFAKGTELYHSGHAAEAIPLLEEVVRADPGNALAQARLGGAYCDVERYQDGLPHLQRAVALDATDYQSRSNLGLAYQRLGQPEMGIAPAREAAALQPANPVVLTNLGWVLLQAKKYAEAVDVYEKAARISPRDANAHYYLALAYLGAGKRDRARAEEEKLQQLDPDLAKQLATELAK